VQALLVHSPNRVHPAIAGPKHGDARVCSALFPLFLYTLDQRRLADHEAVGTHHLRDRLLDLLLFALAVLLLELAIDSDGQLILRYSDSL
jgi:hypothetical protein